MTLSQKERQIRAEIDESFRPLFEKYDDSGIPLQALSVELQKSGTLPRPRVNKLLREADIDRDNRVTYEEFVVRMTGVDDETRKQIGVGRRLLNRAVLSVVPGRNIRRITPDSPDAYMTWSDNAELESYVDAYDCRPPPIFIPLITLAEIAVFLYYALEPNYKVKYPVSATSGCPMDSPLIYNPHKRHEAWRFISYMFLHNGYIHLIFNCFFQIVLGILLELVHKFWRVGLVYLLGVLAGALASSVFDSYTYLAGASGGCYALIGAHFATVIMNWEELQHNWCENPVSFISSGVVRLIILLLLSVGDTGLAVYNRYFVAAAAAKISFAAHGGGFIAGLLIGVPCLRNLDVKRWEKVLFWIFLAIFLILMAVGVLFNAVCGLPSIDKCYPVDPAPRPTEATYATVSKP